MKQTLTRARVTELLKQSKLPLTQIHEIESLDEIPFFDNAEDEVRYWRSHSISRDLLDQIPDLKEDEQ